MIPDHLQEAAYKAAKENRLWWRCTDQDGRPCNGGTGTPLAIGEWSEEIFPVRLCHKGWHATRSPHRWAGERVFLVELGAPPHPMQMEITKVMQMGGTKVPLIDSKVVSSRIRPLAEVDPDGPILDSSVRARLAGPGVFLAGANLWGANFEEAKLWGADLRWAYLEAADLQGADLRGTNLRGTNLRGTNLREADLREADLREADLREANLWGADLREANLWGANLQGADLRWAYLQGADLREADLRWAYLGGADLWRAKIKC